MATNEKGFVCDGIYSIRPTYVDDKEIAVQNASQQDNAQLVIWSINNGTNQKFRVTKVRDDLYKINTVDGTNRAISVSVEASTITPTDEFHPIVVRKFDPMNPYQLWKIIEAKPRYYTIINAVMTCQYTTGRFLAAIDVEWGRESNGTRLCVWGSDKRENQLFSLVLSEKAPEKAEEKNMTITSSSLNDEDGYTACQKICLDYYQDNITWDEFKKQMHVIGFKINNKKRLIAIAEKLANYCKSNFRDSKITVRHIEYGFNGIDDFRA
jgi:hypothetical protein